MVRPLSVLLPLTVAATAANAQFGEFLKNTFGSAQKPLRVVPEALIAKNSHEITSENWRESINVITDPAAAEEDSQEWLFYFTADAKAAGRNVTYWDGVYNDTVFAASSSNPPSKLHFGKVDCSSLDASELCNTFFLSAPYKLPVFYHIATYLANGTAEIRRVPMYRNITEANEMPAFLTKFHSEKQWKAVAPWTGIFNPIDGLLKDYTATLGLALRYYEMVPQWIFMIGVSLLGRTLTSRFTGRAPQPSPL